MLRSILSTTLHLVVPDPHPPSRPLPPPPREDRQQKPATPPTGAASHQQPASAAPQPQQRNSHIFKPMVRSLCIQYCCLIVHLSLSGTWKQPDKWTAVCHFPYNNKKRIHIHTQRSCFAWSAFVKYIYIAQYSTFILHMRWSVKEFTFDVFPNMAIFVHSGFWCIPLFPWTLQCLYHFGCLY